MARVPGTLAHMDPEPGGRHRGRPVAARDGAPRFGLRWRLTLSYVVVTVVAALGMSALTAAVQAGDGGDGDAADAVLKSSAGGGDAPAVMAALQTTFPRRVRAAALFGPDGGLTSATGCDPDQAARLSPAECRTLGTRALAAALDDPATAAAIDRAARSGDPGGATSRTVGGDGLMVAPLPAGKGPGGAVAVLFDGPTPAGEASGAWPAFLAQWRATASPAWLPLLLAVVVAGTATGALLSGRLVRRLHAMAATVRTWSLGDLAATADPTGRDELAALATDLNYMAEQLRNLLAARRDIARAEERHVVRRELHDGVKQELFAAAMHLAAARATLAPIDAATAAHLADADRSAHRAQAELTAIMQAQAPPPLAGAGLSAALEALAEDFARAAGFPLALYVPAALTVSDATAQTLYRVSQEAVTNVRRHARASAATLTLEATPGGYELTVTDNGAGLGDRPHGQGLSGIRERVRLAGGRLDLESGPGGTRLHVRLPADDRPPADD